MVNRYRPHVLVLPEDDANRQLANGFHLELPQLRRMQVLIEAGGGDEVLRRFEVDHIGSMDHYPDRFMVLLIDFDGSAGRLEQAQARIPDRLRERVFILGAWTEPEALRKADLGSYEDIGRKLAEDCRAGTDTIWGHDLLRHNAQELGRLRERVRPVLFEC